MQLVTVFSLLVSLCTGAATQRTTTVRTVECEMVPLSECSVSCGGGWQLMKYACSADVREHCECPTNPVYYQCNNRPCLSDNASLLDIFYDAEDQQQELSGYEYYEDDSAVLPAKPRKH